MSIIRPYYYLVILASLLLGFGYAAQTHASTNFDGFFADFGFGYREVNSGTSSSVIVNGTPIPSTLSSGQPANTVSVFTLGYNLPIDSVFKLGIGANISPASGQAQQTEVQARNQVVSLPGIKPLYNYGFFLAPSVVIGDGLAYLKVGSQTQVNNSNTSPNFNGYLLGIGYKQLLTQSIYIFGEADYGSYAAQTSTRTVSSSGRSINASVTTKPQGSRYLIGVGYQF
jgi:hypothetical protein